VKILQTDNESALRLHAPESELWSDVFVKKNAPLTEHSKLLLRERSIWLE